MMDEEKTREQLLSELELLRREFGETRKAETECRWIEAALRESEQRYRHLIESITDYIYTVKIEDGCPVSTSHGPGCVAVTGYTSESFQIHQDLWCRMIVEEDRDEVLKQVGKILSGEPAKPIEHRIAHKDGSLCWVRNTIIPYYDKEGRLISYDGIIEDITERRMAEEALRESEEMFKAITSGANDAIIMIDDEADITYWNPSAERMFGYSKDEAIGKRLHELIASMPHHSDFDKGFKRFCKSGEGPVIGKTLELGGVRKDGTVFYAEHSISAVKIKGRWNAIGIVRDVSDRKKAEEKLREEAETTASLLTISEATAQTTDIEKLMEQVVKYVHKTMSCDICLSYLWDEEAGAFMPCQSFGLPHDLLPAFRTERLDRKAGRGSRSLEWLSGISAISTMPLKSRKEYLGLVIGVYRRGDLESAYVFTERDRKIMDGIRHQVSVALENAKLYKESVDKTMELSHKIETIQVMHEIDRSVLSTLKTDEILEAVTRLLARMISCDRVTISMVERESEGFVYYAGFGVDIPKGTFIPFSDTSARKVITTGRTEYVGNISEEKTILPFERKLLDAGFLSHIRVPLTVKGENIAVLSIGARRTAAYSKEDLSTIKKLASQIGVALSNARLLSDLEELYLGTVKSLSSAIDAKSHWTAGHSERVTKYALDTGKVMKLSEKELKDLEMAALLHDIGKIGTYETILNKKSGRLTDEEYEMIRQHPGKGAEILAPIRQLKSIIPAIRHHHEFYDGNGYPDRLKGEDIPLFSRILSVADTVDAMGADRPYREGKTMDVIVAELKRCSGTQFDPAVVNAFLKTIALS